MKEDGERSKVFGGIFPTDLEIFTILTIVQEKFSHFWFHIRRKKEFHLLIGVRYPVELSANCHGRFIYGLWEENVFVCLFWCLQAFLVLMVFLRSFLIEYEVSNKCCKNFDKTFIIKYFLCKTDSQFSYFWFNHQ